MRQHTKPYHSWPYCAANTRTVSAILLVLRALPLGLYRWHWLLLVILLLLVLGAPQLVLATLSANYNARRPPRTNCPPRLQNRNGSVVPAHSQDRTGGSSQQAWS